MNIIIVPQNACIVNLFLQKKLRNNSYFFHFSIYFRKKAEKAKGIWNRDKKHSRIISVGSFIFTTSITSSQGPPNFRRDTFIATAYHFRLSACLSTAVSKSSSKGWSGAKSTAQISYNKWSDAKNQALSRALLYIMEEKFFAKILLAAIWITDELFLSKRLTKPRHCAIIFYHKRKDAE